ncbi:uncharacterized protein LOC122425014 [Cervus canadensis]|uniref:uncharacterized protein LOC122425014 n=1 Tax=Cervus canadensis TaxID=1574408 RepID=UPI001CA335FC|nr:uncharacterized protein LOC122425014 [Cervus canadensis]
MPPSPPPRPASVKERGDRGAEPWAEGTRASLALGDTSALAARRASCSGERGAGLLGTPLRRRGGRRSPRKAHRGRERELEALSAEPRLPAGAAYDSSTRKTRSPRSVQPAVPPQSPAGASQRQRGTGDNPRCPERPPHGVQTRGPSAGGPGLAGRPRGGERRSRAEAYRRPRSQRRLAGRRSFRAFRRAGPVTEESRNRPGGSWPWPPRAPNTRAHTQAHVFFQTPKGRRSGLITTVQPAHSPV